MQVLLVIALLVAAEGLSRFHEYLLVVCCDRGRSVPKLLPQLFESRIHKHSYLH
jgi:hypothetical protein